MQIRKGFELMRKVPVLIALLSIIFVGCTQSQEPYSTKQQTENTEQKAEESTNEEIEDHDDFDAEDYKDKVKEATTIIDSDTLSLYNVISYEYNWLE